jgi:MYXO-CTERM domain-containing protein
MKTTIPTLAATLLLAAGAAFAQAPGEVVIEVDEPVLAIGDSTTVRISAGWGGGDYAMAGIQTSLLADAMGLDVASAWSDVALIAPMDGPGTTAGAADGNGFTGILAGQLNFPPGGIYSDPDPNPIPFWEATFTAPAGLGAFNVDLSTRTDRFDVYVERSSARSESRLDGLTEGSGTIFVVPAPAGGLVLLGLAARRRRR